ncbi:precorrin-2 dehydrogenase/sirohydrochlorin ferrochelatase family protein [Candidatus Nitrosocosmicus franklandus]|uniref:precorrin-2 dehydrogenase/sirohydrochlorin ferrochelatase family protein n=1 Tax=Candidatus Nitrosocosmicus franklandianus TaxID=1798806 RepID=UPI0015591800|nr:bifunctional precorrin-2 dehydrogenase/sirohydrochlorin ferrochelatase [Candidatus Nitrosocosmicus franklandus]
MIVDLNLKDKKVLVIGAGVEATKRIKVLSKQGCQIIILSDSISEALYELDHDLRHPILIIKRKVEDINLFNDFDNIFLVLAATSDSELNEKIVIEAKKRNILSYNITNSLSGDIYFTSMINFDDVIQVSISTSGKSPLMSKLIRDRLEDTIKNIIGQKDIDNIKVQEFARQQVKRYIQDQEQRRKFLYSLIEDDNIQELILKKNIDKVKERIITTLGKWEGSKIE